ncbi:MAG: TolC family protein [Muribaculaceae bacterium]|nr:TolC family protein [Muribaculaceae bacterium]
MIHYQPKRSYRRLRVSLSVFLLSITATSAANDGWSVDRCISYAIDNNLRLHNLRLESGIARVEAVDAATDFLPSVSADYSYVPGQGGAAGMNVMLPVFEGLARINRLRFRKLNKSMSPFAEKAAQNDLALEVMEAYYRHYFDKQLHRLAGEQRRLSELYYERTVCLAELGLRSDADLAAMKAALQADLYRETVKANDCSLSLLALKELMNFDAGSVKDSLTITMPEELRPVPAAPTAPDELHRSAESALPEFSIMRIKEQAARASVAAAAGAVWPTVAFEFNLNPTHYPAVRNNCHIGVNVSFPLTERLRNISDIKKEKLRRQQLKNDNERMRIAIHKEIDETLLAFRAATAEYLQAEQQLAAAEASWKAAEEKWSEGMMSVFELIETRNLYLHAKTEIIRTLIRQTLAHRMMQFYRTGSFL